MAYRMSDEEREYYERTRKPVIPIPTTAPGKALFGLGLLVWFAILMLPCAFFFLAINGSITFHHAQIPEPDAHPLLQVDLVMDVDHRGLKITRAVVHTSAPLFCVSTHVDFFLWQQRQPGDLDVAFCDCYAGESGAWTLESTQPGGCTS